MNSIYLIKIQNLINYILSRVILFYVQLGKRKINKSTMLITRLDSIGDYILFRNYLHVLKQSKMYKDFSITLCGNKSWKDLAETFDSNVINDFIWISTKKFYSDLLYKVKILSNIYRRGFEVAIDTVYSRQVLYSDIIIKASNANKKIGSRGSLEKHAYWRRRFFSDSFYNIIIEQTKTNLFEFNRNKEFFEKIIDEKILLEKPTLDLFGYESSIKLGEAYVVVFPGSNDIKKRWDTSNYAEICKHLIYKFGLQVVIPLGGGEKYIGDEISKIVKSEKLIDLSGKCSLTELAAIIAESEIVISNDTAAVHIAAAVGKRFLCISNGSYMGRFLPYPKNIFSKANYIFPDEIMKNLEASENSVSKWQLNSPFDINSITVAKVREKIKDILGDR